MDFSKWKSRCSSLGYIMQDPKGKSNMELYSEAVASLSKKRMDIAALSEKAVKTKEKLQWDIVKLEKRVQALEITKDVKNLSDSCKTHLCDIYTSTKYGRTEDIKSKYLEKGTTVEEDTITLYCSVTKEFHKKNRIRLSNEWIEGECDFVKPGIKVVDTKSNWSIFQFNRVAAKPIKPIYAWQGRGYMWLNEVPLFELAYGLVNTPEKLIAIEEKKLLYDFIGSEEDYIEACKEIRRLHIYYDIPDIEKLRIFRLERDVSLEDKIKERVEDCRIFLNKLDQRIPEEYETED